MGIDPTSELRQELCIQLQSEVKGKLAAFPNLQEEDRPWLWLVAWVLRFQQKLHVYRPTALKPLAIHYGPMCVAMGRSDDMVCNVGFGGLWLGVGS